MKDSVIKGTGNSRYLKSIADFLTQYPTYQDFAAALAAGTLPIDLNGINPEGFHQVGDALDKENLLQDETCDVLYIPRTSVVNDAFLKLALGIGNLGYLFRVTLPDGSPCVGAAISGISAPDGSALVTDKNGKAVGVSTADSVTISVTSPYIDIQSVTDAVYASTGMMTIVDIVLEAVEGYLVLNTSGEYKLSPLVKTYDLTAVGGGGGGTGASTNSDTSTVGAGGGG
nr:hypothetical protein [uncultured Oscillibacter sp.]